MKRRDAGKQSGWWRGLRVWLVVGVLCTSAAALLLVAGALIADMTVGRGCFEKWGYRSGGCGPAAAGAGNLVPADRGVLAMRGVVVTSTRDCAELGPGWTRFSAGNGRFLVGAGASTDKNGITRRFSMDEGSGNDKGEYAHQLNRSELPSYALEGSTLGSTGSHSHGLEFRMSREVGIAGEHRFVAGSDAKGAERFPYNNLRTASGGDHEHNVMVMSGGGDEHHNNIPPYVVLFFCNNNGTQ